MRLIKVSVKDYFKEKLIYYNSSFEKSVNVIFNLYILIIIKFMKENKIFLRLELKYNLFRDNIKFIFRI